MCSIKRNKKILLRQSSVLVLHDLSRQALILTKRSLSLKDHPGEICFPGGRWQKGDKDLYATALRELNEELGVDVSRLRFKKALEVEQTLSGFIIYPWLASIDSLMPCKPNIREVAEVIYLSLVDVKNPQHYQAINVQYKGSNFLSCQYTGSSHFIWGATARILKQLTTTSS